MLLQFLCVTPAFPKFLCAIHDMPISSTTSLVDALQLYHLLEPVPLEQLPALAESIPDPKGLARELIRRDWLTPYQANQLLQGRGAELLLGSYVLLERLGEGGMGQVFKARNWKLGKIVALKLIRKERLSKADSVRRFQREVRAAAALSHPNIVAAYDADEVDGTHVLVMECVERATDLARLVKQHGPLPVEQACEFIRQAALGLQHAHERGMVHRDVKPHNLLATTDGRVKILDMGLARQSQGEDADGSGTMTLEGVVMGTPDYIAPEQALSAHAVDYRADLYSLGCTMYFLLTGQPPFPGGSALDKCIRHREEVPAPIDQLRPEVPPYLVQVASRLLAKNPADRLPSAAAVAEALSGAGSATAIGAIGAGSRPVPGAWGEADTTASNTSIPEAVVVLHDSFHGRQVFAPKVNHRKWLLVGGAAAAALVALLMVLSVAPWRWFRGAPANPDPPVHLPSRSTSTPLPGSVDRAWLQQVAALPADEQVEAVAKRLKEYNRGFDGKIVSSKIVNDEVAELHLSTDQIADISPVQALSYLRKLQCNGSAPGKGQITSLYPLIGLPLTYLDCSNTRIADLKPVHGMPLVSLRFHDTNVADLGPVRDLKKLTELDCSGTPVSDLLPLAGTRLQKLWLARTKATDLTPLRALRLTEIECTFQPDRDEKLLRSIKTLTKINDKPAAEFWKSVAGK
jgi:serine/threonine protein kinase